MDHLFTGRSEGSERGHPPEQLLGREADVRSDIYSAGVVLFEVATGRRPYLERDPFALAVGCRRQQQLLLTS